MQCVLPQCSMEEIGLGIPMLRNRLLDGLPGTCCGRHGFWKVNDARHETIAPALWQSDTRQLVILAILASSDIPNSTQDRATLASEVMLDKSGRVIQVLRQDAFVHVGALLTDGEGDWSRAIPSMSQHVPQHVASPTRSQPRTRRALGQWLVNSNGGFFWHVQRQAGTARGQTPLQPKAHYSSTVAECVCGSPLEVPQEWGTGREWRMENGRCRRSHKR